ncbi:MAG TPA: UDP-N-acetylmuramoyl-tripeptide--D-alanyl-D-alanine ligase [Solirubrobacteraceae bacterium]|nr:UDP-N-acetylmuramoyl-tripeptide--D-alanyl-D-alanine ligase [Solirubrobacteraceae bacterium]
MRSWDAELVAAGAGARLLRAPAVGDPPGPAGAGIDSRATRTGELFVGLQGSRSDGGTHAPAALRAGAWGVLVAPPHAAAALADTEAGAVLEHPDPLAGLQALALAWREQLGRGGTRVVAITGSAGKTSTKDILAAVLAPMARTAASPANHNTEIGLPLAILGAGEEVEVLVLELAMRGPGQIAELTGIARPEVGVIVNVGAAHLELLGSLEAIAAAKAELIAGMASGSTAVVPFGEPLLEPHLRGDLRTISFGGDGADVTLSERHPDGTVVIRDHDRSVRLRPSFSQAHNLQNLLAAVAAARSLGYTPEGELRVEFSAMRGQRHPLPGGGLLIEDCYNANPMSMRAALEDLAASAPGRRVAVLGDMLELGEQAPALHREVGRRAGEAGVDLLVAVGSLAPEMAAGFPGEVRTVPDANAAAGLVPRLLAAGDTVLVKGSRGVGLEVVCGALRGAADVPDGGHGAGHTPGPGLQAQATAPGPR